ncbi:MAG TPA: DNA cytosine methyltransferase [Terriglobales bacterium]|nr:DNA cytosine methyltransferase [Terriglobales bacterium]
MTQESNRLPWYEFFAGGGMARLGLGEEWQCTFSNEWCEKKAAAYKARFGGGNELHVCDVADLKPHELPGVPTLVWASFPCQDLSLAGNGAGLAGDRSGTFKPFWRLMRGIISIGRVPQIVVLENVIGTLTSHDGRDFAAIVGALSDEGYRVGALVIDAVRFLPHSRPRLFIVAVHSATEVQDHVLPAASEPWHTPSLQMAHSHLSSRVQNSWVWWWLPAPTTPVPAFSTIIEDEPTGVGWHSQEQTERLISLMSPLHLQKLKKAQHLGRRIVGTVYRRSRPNEAGVMVQRAEIRFDQISGCLRTPVGGSSRQTIVVVDGHRVRSRLLSPREAARLMGVPEDYALPTKYNEAYHLFGDGLAVPVVRWLSAHLLTPIAATNQVMIAA